MHTGRSRFYGPSVTTVSSLIQPWLKIYVDMLKFDFNETPYLFHVGSDTSRNMSSSQWCSVVKSIFARWSPRQTACAPKTLRSVRAALGSNPSHSRRQGDPPAELISQSMCDSPSSHSFEAPTRRPKRWRAAQSKCVT